MNQYANDFTNTVRIYYDELRRYKPISKAKERRLLKQCKRGNLKARNELLEANLRFVFDIARRYTGRGVPISDLISEGNMGLLKAIDKFDETKDVKFISYAVWWIKQAILEALKKNTISFVEINPYEANDISIVNRTANDDDNDDEHECQEYSNEYDEKVKEITSSKRKVIEEVIVSLNERERDIIECYYGLNEKAPLNLVEIGKKYNLTSERIRRIKLCALRKLRSKIMLCDDFEDLFI